MLTYLLILFSRKSEHLNVYNAALIYAIRKQKQRIFNRESS